MKVPTEEIHKRVENLNETNPMLGMFFCQVGLNHHGVYEMQPRPLFGAVTRVTNMHCDTVRVDVMISFISSEKKMRLTRKQIMLAAERILGTTDPLYREIEVNCSVSAMIKVSRAAL